MLQIDLDEFGRLANWQDLEGTLDLPEIRETCTAQWFPGAVLPVVDKSKGVYWYAAVGTDAEWSELQPLLRAYVGPTISSFNGEKHVLRAGGGPTDIFLLEAAVTSVGLILPPEGGEERTARALARLSKVLKCRPKLTRDLPLSTSAMLAQFEMSIAEGDRREAQSCLDKMIRDWRLDVLNQRFCIVKLHVSFGEWSAILDYDWFDDICDVKKSIQMSRVLLEAIWKSKLRSYEVGSASFKAEYRSLRPNIRSLLAEVSPETSEISSTLHEFEQGSFSDHARHLPSQHPSTWSEWFKKIGQVEKFRARDVAEDLAFRSPARNLEDSAEIDGFASNIFNPVNTIAQERLVESLPILVMWLQAEPDYPNARFRPIYESVFGMLLLYGSNGKAERECALDMLHALLKVGQSQTEYDTLMQDAIGLIPDGAGRNSCFWLFDLADLVLNEDAKNESSRQMVLNQILSALSVVEPALGDIQRSAYNQVALVAGWPLLELKPKGIDSQANNWKKFSLIGIYTLRESAARNARNAVLSVSPDVRVEISTATVCTDRLKNLAKTADLFVVAASCATHAATECIVDHRGGQPIEYAAGKGFSSLLRAIENATPP